MPAAQRVMLVLLFAATGLLGACASRHFTSPAAPPTAAEILAAPVPPGVDAQLWHQLTAKLAEIVAARTTSTAEQPPQGKGSIVRDVWVHSTGVQNEITWTYRCQGDYDLNG